MSTNIDILIRKFETTNEITLPLDENSDIRISLYYESIYDCATFTLLFPQKYEYEEALPIVNTVFYEFDSNAYKIRAKKTVFKVHKELMDYSFHNIIPKRLGWMLNNDYPSTFYGTFTARVSCSQNYMQKYIEVETTMTIADVKRLLNIEHLNPVQMYVTHILRHNLILPDQMRLEEFEHLSTNFEPFELCCQIKPLTS